MPLAEHLIRRAFVRNQQTSPSPLLTVVMATLNAAPDLPGSLGSLAAQDSRDFEVVLVDGGSSDATCQLAASLLEAAGIPHRIVELPGSGIYEALNRGLREAEGEWVYVIGADDRLNSDGILTAVAQVLRAAKPQVLVVHGDVWIENPGYRYGQPWDWPRFLERNISHQSAFYRRRPIQRMGIEYNPTYRLYADWDYNLKLFAVGPFQHVPLLIAVYACTGLSSRSKDKLFLSEKERNVRRYLGWRSIRLMPPHRFALAAEPNSGSVYRVQFFLNRLFWTLKRFFQQDHGSS
jgi:glycosyltransferase involved in cell wall biosynthesis